MTTTATGKSIKNSKIDPKELNDKIKAKLAKKNILEDVKKVNKSTTLQQVITNRELKWKYPKDCIDTLARKAFRQKSRNKIRLLGRAIEKADKTQKAKALKEMEAFRKEVLVDVKAEA
jgi:hypothetical protein